MLSLLMFYIIYLYFISAMKALHYIYTYIYVSIKVYIYICICMYVCMYVGMYVRTYVYVCMYMCIYIYLKYNYPPLLCKICVKSCAYN